MSENGRERRKKSKKRKGKGDYDADWREHRVLDGLNQRCGGGIRVVKKGRSNE